MTRSESRMGCSQRHSREGTGEELQIPLLRWLLPQCLESGLSCSKAQKEACLGQACASVAGNCSSPALRKRVL